MAMMGLFEDVAQEAGRYRDAANFSAQLKDHVLNVPPVATADVVDLLDKTFSVFDMTMNGIQIAATIADALTLTQSMRLVADASLDTQAASTAIKGAGRFSLAPPDALEPLATYVCFWIDPPGPWAEDKVKILKDNAARGMSAGVTLGANDAGPAYVASHFWQHAKGSYPAYREMEAAAKNMHNIALVAGYGQGKSLTKTQKGRLLAYLHGKMSEGDRAYYFSVNHSEWGATMKRYYYILCAALFRSYHLE
jgi:hypothetical protein